MIIFAEGGHFSLMPTVCAFLFGEHAETVFSVAFSFACMSKILAGVLVVSFLSDYGYPAFYYFGSGLTVISLLMLVFLFEEKKFC